MFVMSSLIIPSTFLFAQKLKVFVTDQCSADTVGERIAYQLREGLNSSSSYVVEDEYAGSTLQLSLVCIAPDERDRGVISRYSYAITYMNASGVHDYFVTHGVGVCGSTRVKECAEGLVATFDSSVREAKGALKRQAQITKSGAKGE